MEGASGEGGGEPMRAGLLGWYGPGRRPWVETSLLLAVLALAAEEALVHWSRTDDPLRVPQTVAAGLASLSLLLARRYPVASAVLPVLTGGLLNRAPPGLCSVYYLACLGRVGPAVVGGTVIAVLNAARADTLVGWAGTTGSQLLLQAVTLSVGLWLHDRRVLIRTLREQVETLSRERELRADQARSAERARIAREMHDVLAHRLCLLVLHAGVLRDQARAGAVAEDPDRLAHRLELLRTTAARSLDDLRDVLGALRSDPPPRRQARGPRPPSGDPGPRAEESARVAAPALRDLTELVGEAVAAGQEVELALAGDPETVPTTHRLAVHRLVQEALTNARRHARAAPVTVRVGYGAPATTVEVRNGPGSTVSNGPANGGGYGLWGSPNVSRRSADTSTQGRTATAATASRHDSRHRSARRRRSRRSLPCTSRCRLERSMWATWATWSKRPQRSRRPRTDRIRTVGFRPSRTRKGRIPQGRFRPGRRQADRIRTEWTARRSP